MISHTYSVYTCINNCMDTKFTLYNIACTLRTVQILCNGSIDYNVCNAELVRIAYVVHIVYRLYDAQDVNIALIVYSELNVCKTTVHRMSTMCKMCAMWKYEQGIQFVHSMLCIRRTP